MPRAKRTIITVATAVVVLLAGALAVTLLTQGKSHASSDGLVEYPVGQRPLAPDFTATTLTGTRITFSSYHGKVVVLNFWGSWCSPCRGEAPTLEVLFQRFGPQGVSFLGDDVADTPVNALSFIKSVGITYPSVNDPGYAVVADFSQVAPVSDTPTTVVIDRTGHIAGMVLGASTYAELTSLLRFAGVTR